jgi:peptide/nickel transport system substrate-binding protein
MITYLRNNMGTCSKRNHPTGLPSFNNAKGYTYDSEKAKLVNEYKENHR